MSRWARKLDKLFPGTPTCNQNGVTFPERLSIYTYIERSEKFNQIVLPQLHHTSQPFAFALIKLICLWIIIAFILKCAFYSSVLFLFQRRKMKIQQQRLSTSIIKTVCMNLILLTIFIIIFALFMFIFIIFNFVFWSMKI